MNKNALTFCAVVLMMIQTVASAQRTRVQVQKGKVIAQTATESVMVEAGRKVVLMPDKELIVTIADPMVDDLTEIYKWVQQEIQAQREQIETTSIQVIKIEGESRFTLAYLLERPNTRSEPSDTCRVAGVSILEDPRFYDLQGNLLAFDVDKIDARRGDYFVHFLKPVGQHEKFRYICVSKLNGSMWKDGPLWHLQAGWNVPHCLNYFRFILPRSAIFVDSNRKATVVDSHDGDVAVTLRNTTGPMGDGTSHIAFLWPEKDGTTLADLPTAYRGLRSEKDEDIVRTGQLAMAKILAGEPFQDQRNPLAAVGTLCSAIVRKDKELFLNLMANPNIKAIAAQQYDDFIRDTGRTLVESFDFLNTPTWPEKPENGTRHPVYLSRKGSLLRDATVTMEYQDGKWYSGGLFSDGGTEAGVTTGDRQVPKSLKVSKDRADLSVATYKGLEPGRFMRDWLMLGPFSIPWHGEGYFPDDKTQKKAFDSDSLDLQEYKPTIVLDGNDYRWAALHCDFGVIDLTQAFENWYQIAYLWAQVDMSKETSGVLGIGSDDGVKVWLNGRLIHENWTTRGVEPDKDLVPVTFQKGKNQLVLKIQNGGGPWGFACRLLEQ